MEETPLVRLTEAATRTRNFRRVDKVINKKCAMNTHAGRPQIVWHSKVGRMTKNHAEK